MRQIKVCRTAVLGLGLVLCVWPVWTQQTGIAPPSGSGTAPTPSPTPKPTPRSSPSPSVTNQDSRSSQDLTRPIFLSGKVVLEDGMPPPESVVIQRVCGAMARPETYTDSKGRFSFQVGQNSSMILDASVGSDLDFPGMGGQNPRMGAFDPTRGINTGNLAACGLRASLPGYRSDEISLNGIRSMDHPDIGTIVLHRYGTVEGATISLTSLQAPNNAQRAFEKGRAAMNKSKWEEARKQFEKAVGIYPGYADAWCELGRTLEKSGDIEGARKAYAEAVAKDAKFVNPYLQLASIEVKEQHWKEVVDTTDRIVKLNPTDFPAAYFFNSVANYNMHDYVAAETSAREALKLDKQQRFPLLNQILGFIRAQKGDFAAAAEYMKSYLKLAPTAGDVDQVKKQLVEVEKLAKARAGVTR
jgi:tetratricopeptide (TPR) repeat protein